MLAFEDGKIRVVDVPDDEVKGRSDNDILERIFYWGQNEFAPQPICSVSVGDVVEYNDKFFLVQGAGWKELSEVEMDNYKKFDRNDRIKFSYGF